jgi:hypothetical protein
MRILGTCPFLNIVGLSDQATAIAPELMQCSNHRLKIHRFLSSGTQRITHCGANAAALGFSGIIKKKFPKQLTEMGRGCYINKAVGRASESEATPKRTEPRKDNSLKAK